MIGSSHRSEQRDDNHHPNDTMSQLTTETLTTAIEEVMNDTGCTKLQAISGLQSACAKLGDESVLEMLCEMKWELIDA